jgi:ubiquinol-cytochrome c reductase cytochrome c subunit
VVLLFGLLLSGGLYAAFAPASADQTQSQTGSVEEGRKLFLVGCSFCHGANGEGVLTEGGTQYGPSLAGVGAAAVDFQVGTGRMPMAQPGAQAELKEPVYDDEEIADLAAYVASLGPGPAIPDESDYSLEGMTEEERIEAVARGGQIFLTNCTACHNFEGSGGAMPRGGQAPRSAGSSRSTSTRPCSRVRSRWTPSPTATCPPTRSATSSPTSRPSTSSPATAASASAASAR